MGERGFVCPAWPQEYGGGGLGAAEARVVAEELRRIERGRSARLRPLDDRAGAAPARQRGAEARAPAAIVAGRDPLVSGLLRAGRGLGPREPADARRPRRRRLRPERPEGLDVATPTRPTGCSSSCAPTSRRRSTTASRSCLMDMTTPGVSVRPIKLISGVVAVLRDLLRRRARAGAQRRRQGERAAGRSPRRCSATSGRMIADALQGARRRASRSRRWRGSYLGRGDGADRRPGAARPRGAGRDGPALPRPDAARSRDR